MDFSLMKYGELQALAKSHGIKANQRAETIIECLKKVLGSVKDVDGGRKKSVSPTKTVPEIVSSKLAVNENKSSVKRSKKQKNDSKKAKPEIAKKSPAASPSKRASTAASKPSVLPLKTPSPRSRSSLRNQSSGAKLLVPEDGGKKSSGRKESAKKEDAPRIERGSSQKKENKNKKRILETSGEDEQLEPMRKKLRSSAGNTKQNCVEKKQAGDNPSSNIPRYVRPSSSKTMEKKTFDADYWLKVHQKNQEKMESIDEYQKKKQDRAKLLMSNKKPSVMSARKSPRLLAVPSAQKIFVPVVTSIDKVDFNFSKIPTRAVEDKTHTHNLTYTRIEAELLTPPMKSSHKNADKMAVASTARRKSMFSPKPSDNNTLTNSVARPKFDLAASLDKPLTWVPYKGKVKPLSEQDEGNVKHVKKSRLRTDPKDVQLRSKQEKRAETRSAWKSRRDTLVMNKRSIKQ